MIIFRHEFRQNFKTLLIWSLIVGALTLTFMTMYVSLQGDIEGMADMYADMGNFSAAFGMDKISFGTAMGFYGVEAGAMLSICGAMFGAMTGISVLSKEEHNHTAEFLLTHPVGRIKVTAQKLLFTVVQVCLFNLVCFGFGMASFAVIDEKLEFTGFLLFHVAQLVMHLEVACICFLISAFTRRQNTGLGIGIAAILYFMGMIYNIGDNAKNLKYITPFVYADAGTVISKEAIDMGLMGIGILVAVVCAAMGILRYQKKDIAA